MHSLRPSLLALAALWLAGFCAISGGSLHAQNLGFFAEPDPAAAKAPAVEPSLVAGTTAVSPGVPFTVGVRFKLSKGWHLYWQFPGDSGAAPQVFWNLPPGFEAGPIQWPLPHLLRSEGDLFTHIYEEELLLPVEIRPPQTLPPAPFVLKAQVKWFACAENCVPGGADLAMELPAGEAAPTNTELFAHWQKQLPERGPAPFSVSWQQPDAKTLRVSVQNIPEGHSLELFPLPPKGTNAEHPETATPPPAQGAAFQIPVSGDNASLSLWKALFVLTSPSGERRGWEIAASQSQAHSANPPAPLQSPSPESLTAGRATDETAPSPGWIAILWGAFLGGLLLNLMPCVLPVIALKILGFTQQAGQDPRRVFRLGLAFCGGVFAFFLALALAVIGLRAAGGGLNWGFQFQNPWVLTALLSAVFVFGLNLLGVFEITLTGSATAKLSELSSRHGYGGAFLHGAFTTLLGTSCTAPYLGATLGFAVSQPVPVVLAVFAMVAAGMSLPYLLLTSNPALLRFLPKPGVWMERLKQVMGFVILGVAVWLLSILGQVRGLEALVGACAYLLLLGTACWLLGVLRTRVLAWTLALGIAAGGYAFFLHPALSRPAQRQTQDASSEWEPFSPERIAREQSANRPVFVDFTADWCLNCKVNEHLTLSKPEVMAAFRAKGVVLLKADWTEGDPAITAELKKYGRVGVPFYLLLIPGKEPVSLPELLTPGIVLEALQALPDRAP